jgi:hypothetical protein
MEEKLEELRAQMTSEERAKADEIEKMPPAQRELALVTLIAASTARSTTLNDGQKSDLLCATFNFYAIARTCGMMENVVEQAMRDGGSERGLKVIVASALLVLYEKRKEIHERLAILSEMLEGAP